MGAAFGASLALLLAPQSGRQTRERLSDMATGVRDKALDLSGELRDKAEDVLEEGQRTLETNKSNLSAAVQTGRETIQRGWDRLSG